MVPQPLVTLPPSTGSPGERTLPQASVTVGNEDGAVAIDSQFTVELLDTAEIEIALPGAMV